MDAKNIDVADAAPLMRDLEEALLRPEVEMVELRDGMSDPHPIRFTRAQAEELLAQLEAAFFATAH